MNARLKTIFFILMGVLLLLFLYIERAILTPFVLGAVFAYLFNPIVNFITNKIKLPRILSILIIYTVIIGSVVFLGILITKRIVTESTDFRIYTIKLLQSTKDQVATLPDWLQPAIEDTLVGLQTSRIFSTQYLFSLFPQAISRILSFVIFAFSGFYFLKEGGEFIDKILLIVPPRYKVDVEILFRRINKVLNGYLRGQIFLVVLVSSVLFIALSILGVRFALVLAVFSGVAEIIPVIGPIVATSVAAIVVLVTGTINFSLSPIQGALVVVLAYFIIRQLQDYFVNPLVMHRITKLHPLIILFAVLSGEHLWGILGLVLAVPVAAVIKLFLEFSLDIINEQEQ